MSRNNKIGGIRVGIDCSNIVRGGGLTHMKEVLLNVDIGRKNISKVIIFASRSTLEQLPDRSFIVKKHQFLLDKNFICKSIWKLFFLDYWAKKECDILFNPGGGAVCRFEPMVTMCQNMLVFDTTEAARYKFTLTWFRFYLLRRLQLKSMRQANGLIWISKYAETYLKEHYAMEGGSTAIVHHGVNPTFRQAPKEQKHISEYTEARPFRILYVSIIDYYKHQWVLAEAILQIIKQKAYHIELILVGPIACQVVFNRLKQVLARSPQADKYVKYQGEIAYQELRGIYQNADAFAFSSTCENMPNILIEAMSSGLPIASSNYPPMPEFIKDSAFYYDPTCVHSVRDCLIEMLEDPSKRQELAELSYAYSQKYSWKKCANSTFDFLEHVYNESVR